MSNEIVQKQSVEEEMRGNINGLAVIEVVDAETFALADERRKAIVALEKRIVDYWKGIKESAYKTWKGLCLKETEMLEPLARKKEEQRLLANKWADDQEKWRREEERKAQEAAKKQADEDAIKTAEELDSQGYKEEAEAVLGNVQAPQVVVPTSVPSGHGQMTKKYYSAKVVNIKVLARAVLDGKVPEVAIQGNETFLNNQARIMKETLNYPGVAVVVR